MEHTMMTFGMWICIYSSPVKEENYEEMYLFSMRTEDGSSKLPTKRGHFVRSEMYISLTFVSLWATTNWVDELPGSEDPGLGGMLYCFLFAFLLH